MTVIKLKNTYWVKRFLALALTVAALASLAVPASAAFVDFSGTTVKSDMYNIVTFYEWHRINTQDDFPKEGTRCPILIMWDTGSDIYYCDGGYAGNKKFGGYGKWDYIQGKKWPADDPFYPNPFDGVSESTNTFYTLNVPTTWEMYMTGKKDGDNKNVWRVRLFPTNKVLLTGWDDWDFPSGVTSADYDLWSIHTSDAGGKYGNGLDAGKCRIYANVKYSDTGFQWSSADSSKCFGWCDNTYNYDQFAVYWAEERTFSAITDNYTVGNGMVMNIDDGAMLMDDVTLIVEPGGVLSIEGQFFNNGVIENHGTVILQPNACVCSFLPSNDDSGKIICDGTDVSPADNAKRMRELKTVKLTKVKSEIKEIKVKVDESEKELKAAKSEMNSLSNAELLEIKQYNEAVKQAIASIDEMMAGIEDEDERDAYIAVYRELIEVFTMFQYPAVMKQNEIQSKIDSSVATIEQYSTELAEKNALVEKLESERQYWSEIIKKKSGVTEKGEGNLIVMENARLAFNRKADSRLVIQNGGSCVCNGYIVSPYYITLDNSQLLIRRTGVVITEYYFASGLGSIRTAAASGSGQSITLPGLKACGSLSEHSVVCSGDYHIVDEGIFKYSDSPAYDADEKQDIKFATKVMDPITGATTYSYENGNKLVVELDGTKTWYYADGSSEMTKLDGTRKIRQMNGACEEWWTNGSHFKLDGSGEFQWGVRTEENGNKTTYVGTYPYGYVSIEYAEKLANGIIKQEKYTGTSQRNDYYANGTVKQYDKYGALTYSYEPMDDGSTKYIYPDRIERTNAWGNTVYVEYTDGDILGATASISDSYYNEQNGLEKFENCKEGDIFWEVTAIDGSVLECRYMGYYEVDTTGLLAYYDCSALVTESGVAEIAWNVFEYHKYLEMFGYTGKVEFESYGATPVICKKEITKTDDEGRTLYYYSDGSYALSVNSGGVLTNVNTGSKMWATCKAVYSNGAVATIYPSYYEKMSARSANDELWVIEHPNGTTTKCSMAGNSSSVMVTFPDGVSKTYTRDINPDILAI